MQPNFGIGSTLVGATAANVTCGYLSGMSATVNEGPYTVGWTLQATQDDHDIVVDIDIALGELTAYLRVRGHRMLTFSLPTSI